MNGGTIITVIIIVIIFGMMMIIITIFTSFVRISTLFGVDIKRDRRLYVDFKGGTIMRISLEGVGGLGGISIMMMIIKLVAAVLFKAEMT